MAPGLFDAARVGLGALGVLTAVTFRVVPAFWLAAREQPMRYAEVIARLDELTSENKHFEFYWFPHTEGCLTKRNNPVGGPARPLPGWRHWLDDEFLSNTVFGLTCRLGHRAPGLIPTVNSVAARALAARTYTDAAYRVFTSPRRVRVHRAGVRDPAGRAGRRAWRAAGAAATARLADQLPGRGAGGPAGRAVAVHRLPAGQRLHRGARVPCLAASRSTSAASRRCMTGLGGRPALGQAAHPAGRLPERQLPEVRRLPRAARCARPRAPVRQPVPGAGARPVAARRRQ